MAFRRKPGRSTSGSKRSDAGEAGRPEAKSKPGSTFKSGAPSKSKSKTGSKTDGPPRGPSKGGREVDERKTRAALRKLRRAVEEAEERAAKDGGDAAKLSDWEREFAKSVETKLTTYGSAFRDPSKGSLEEPLSARQNQKLREIGRKAAGKGGGLRRGSSFKQKPPSRSGGRVRDVTRIEDGEPPSDAPDTEASSAKTPSPKKRRGGTPR